MPASPLGPRDRLNGRLGHGVRLVEGQLRVERRIAGGRDPGGVGHGREADAARPKRREQLPVEHEPGRRRFECDRERSRPGPNVPQRQRLLDMRVLDRPAMPCDAVPDRVGCPGKLQGDEARVAEETQHGGLQRAQRQGIARAQLGGRGAVFGAAAMIAGAEDDGRKPPHVVHGQRAPAGQSDLDGRSAPLMHAAEARGYGGGVVGDEQVAGTQMVGQLGTHGVMQPAVAVDDQESGVRRALSRSAGDLHPTVSSFVRGLR